MNNRVFILFVSFFMLVGIAIGLYKLINADHEGRPNRSTLEHEISPFIAGPPYVPHYFDRGSLVGISGKTSQVDTSVSADKWFLSTATDRHWKLISRENAPYSYISRFCKGRLQLTREVSIDESKRDETTIQWTSDSGSPLYCSGKGV